MEVLHDGLGLCTQAGSLGTRLWPAEVTSGCSEGLGENGRLTCREETGRCARLLTASSLGNWVPLPKEVLPFQDQ